MFNIFQKVKHNGGITIDKTGKEYKGKGYAVALSKETEIVINEDLFIPELISHIMKLNADKLSKENVFLGIWQDSEKVYFDLSEIIADKDQAIAKGKERDQLAIFDFTTFETIEIKE